MGQQKFHVRHQNFINARVLLAEFNPQLRMCYEDVLVKIGFKNILSTDNLVDVKNAIVGGKIDLLICDTSMEDGGVINLIRAMRLGLLGGDIFPIVISTITNPTHALVQKVIDSGSDNILVKPIAFQAFKERILQLASRREAFVVTSDYIGPDRRQKRRPDAMEVPKTQVPNPLHNKVTGFYSEDAYNACVSRAVDILNKLRIERQCYQIGYLVERIHPEGTEVVDHRKLPVEWRRLVFTARDLAKRVKGSPYAHVNGMACTLVSFVKDMDETGSLTTNDVQLLSHLSQGISRGLSLG